MSIASVVQKLERGPVILEHDPSDGIVSRLREAIGESYVVLDPVHGSAEQEYFILPVVSAMKQLAYEIYENGKFTRGNFDEVFIKSFNSKMNQVIERTPSLNPKIMGRIASKLFTCPEIAGMEMVHNAQNRSTLPSKLNEMAMILCNKVNRRKVIAVLDCLGETPSVDAMIKLRSMCGEHFSVIVNVQSTAYCKMRAKNNEMTELCSNCTSQEALTSAAIMVDERIEKYMECDTLT